VGHPVYCMPCSKGCMCSAASTSTAGQDCSFTCAFRENAFALLVSQAAVKFTLSWYYISF